MSSHRGFLIYRIFYGDTLVYIGRTKQTLQSRMHGHMFSAPMHRTIDINNVTLIEYAELPTEADMNIYEIYYICKEHPPLKVDDRAKDKPTIILPNLAWKPFVPANWEAWKLKLSNGKAPDGFASQQARMDRSKKLWEIAQKGAGAMKEGDDDD